MSSNLHCDIEERDKVGYKMPMCAAFFFRRVWVVDRDLRLRASPSRECGVGRRGKERKVNKQTKKLLNAYMYGKMYMGQRIFGGLVWYTTNKKIEKETRGDRKI